MHILFLDELTFPYGNAFASRARCLCSLFVHMGHTVHVISPFSNDKTNEAKKVYAFENYTYQIASSSRNKSWMTFVGNPDFIPCVKKYLEENKVDLIFSSACHTYYFSILKLAKKYKAKYVVEQCEWLDVSNFKFGKFDARYILGNYIRQHGYCKASGIVAISRLLKDYYSNLGIKVIRVPTILDVRGTEYRKEVKDNSKIVLVYTGNPGVSKEFLLQIFQAIDGSNLLKAKMEFHIYGPNKTGVLNNIGHENGALLEKLNDCVFIHGHVEQQIIEEIIRSSDYQIFIRPDRNSSNAGFPTKLGESMSVGTPVIANITGDIGLYLKDSINGFTLDSIDPLTIRAKLETICHMSKEDRTSMRVKARETAESSFELTGYLSVFETFFDDVQSVVNE